MAQICTLLKKIRQTIRHILLVSNGSWWFLLVSNGYLCCPNGLVFFSKVLISPTQIYRTSTVPTNVSYGSLMVPTGVFYRSLNGSHISLKAPTHRPDVQLPYLTTLRPLCCLSSDPCGRKVALNTPLRRAAYSAVACTFCACARCNKPP